MNPLRAGLRFQVGQAETLFKDERLGGHRWNYDSLA